MNDKLKQAHTVSSNISVFSERIEAAREQTDISLRQLAECVLDIKGGSIERAYFEFCRMLGGGTAEQKALFCRYIAATAALPDILAERSIFGEGEDALPGTHGRIAYVRNKRGDEAYTQLAKSRRGSKAYNVASFGAACESVWENTSEFCIVPIENNTDGRLYSFYSMLDRYELKICGTVKIRDEDTSNHTVFALASRCPDTALLKSTPKRFEFAIINEDTDFVGDVIEVLRILGGRLYYVGVQPLPYDDVRRKYYFAADFTTASPIAAALYASLEYPRYVPIGVYTLKK